MPVCVQVKLRLLPRLGVVMSLTRTQSTRFLYINVLTPAHNHLIWQTRNKNMRAFDESFPSAGTTQRKVHFFEAFCLKRNSLIILAFK